MAHVSGRNLALTGVPRGGTTLACRLLGLCADTVALFEPMDVTGLPTHDPPAAVERISAFFDETRAQLLESGSAPSKQRDGQVPDNPFDDERTANGPRRIQVAPGRIRIEPMPDPDFTLVIKHNAAFTALLPLLAERFETIAIVRHPLSVLASWNSVDLPVRDGRLPAGERLDAALAARLALEPLRLHRQLIVLDWFFARFATALPPSRVVRYEDLIASHGAELRALAGLSGSADGLLSERNSNAAYSHDDVSRLALALQRHPGHWQHWYPADSIAPLAQRMRQQARRP